MWKRAGRWIGGAKSKRTAENASSAPYTFHRPREVIPSVCCHCCLNDFERLRSELAVSYICNTLQFFPHLTQRCDSMYVVSRAVAKRRPLHLLEHVQAGADYSTRH